VPQRAISIPPLSPSPPGSTIFLTNRPTSGNDNGGVERFLRRWKVTFCTNAPFSGGRRRVWSPVDVLLYSLHKPPLGGASNGAEVLAGAKLCDSLVIESSVMCKKSRLYLRAYTDFIIALMANGPGRSPTEHMLRYS